MTGHIIRRLIQSVIVIFLVTVVVFSAMRFLPGDPIMMLVTRTTYQTITPERIDELRHEAGLDKPVVNQYFNWLGGVLHGDFGHSILDKTDVMREVKQRIPVTLHLGILAFIVGMIIGIPAGVISAVRRGKWADTFITAIANLGITVPSFWLGYLLMYWLALKAGWLPIMGYTSPFEDFWLGTRQLVMPVICLSAAFIAQNARQTRSSVLEVLHQDYIRTAWSKGLGEQTVIMKHVLKNSLIPVVTLSGVGLGQILGGTVLIETVFVIPGMGLLAVSSINNHDYPYVQAVVMVVAVAVVLVNLIVDISYGWLDPRIRYR
jgi:peptide/nickel transport system permease protein